MGVDFVALLGHHLDSSGVRTLPSTLRTATSLTRAAVALEAAREPCKSLSGDQATWLVDDRAVLPADRWAVGEFVNLEGPCGLCLSVGPRIALISCIMRWTTFLTQPLVQAPVRQVCYEIACLLDSPLAIYLPDSGLAISAAAYLPGDDGSSLEQVLAWLREHHGPPAPSIADIYKAHPERGTSSGDGYYIDTFSDVAVRLH